MGRSRPLSLRLKLLAGRVLNFADEEHQLLTVFVRLSMGRTPGGHSRQAHAILDDVMDFSIGQVLRGRLTQVRRLGIKGASDLVCAVPL